jgi:POT family proton-dependent oligopeptide transporter
MMGVYTLSVSLGSVISGRLGGLYEKLSPFEFWSLHAALCASGGVMLLLIGAVVSRGLLRDAGTPENAPS